MMKDYLYFYIGCEVECALGIFKLIGVEENSAIVHNKIYGRKIYSAEIMKPVLRPLSDMSGQERKEWERLYTTDADTTYEMDARLTAYLLSNGFDLFGLLEKGLAISKPIKIK